MKLYFTPTEVAKICNISYATVVNYCEQQKIENIKSPITNHRKIARESLEQFLQQHDIPLTRIDEYDALKIMLVEDSEADQLAIRKILKKGFGQKAQVQVHDDGYSALIHLGQYKPDVLILDIFIPKIDGFEVCKTIKSNPDTADIKIIAISGREDKQTMDRVMASGADVFYAKPLRWLESEFIRQVSSLARVRSLLGKEG